MSVSENKRTLMQSVVGDVRAYFAPVDRTANSVTAFDPNNAGFDLAAPPSPWVDLGWVRGFERKAGAKPQSVRTGTAGIARLQFREVTDVAVAFEFCEWGKLQMTLAAGSQHLNVLESVDEEQAPSGGVARPAVALAPGSTAEELRLSPQSLARFDIGDLVAVDVDYFSQRGFVGTGIAGAYVRDCASAQRDIDYIRRVTLNVGRIAAKTDTSLKLAQPVLGGAPEATARVQKVVAFVDREGPSYLQEWSGLFVMEPESGGRLSYYYPRLQTAAAASESMTEIGHLRQAALRGSFVALPIEDPLDSEQVVCYRSFVPDRSAALY